MGSSRDRLRRTPGAPAITAANPINFCDSPKGQTLNQQAPFQATVNGSYDVPIGPVSGYLRFNVAYQGKNPNFGNDRSATGAFDKTSPFAIVDLFAGVAGQKGEWELGIFAKNLFNEQRELRRTPLLSTVYAPFATAPAGYSSVLVTTPRVIGATVRYSFGSR